jgi:hypothetical protein
VEAAFPAVQKEWEEYGMDLWTHEPLVESAELRRRELAFRGTSRRPSSAGDLCHANR